MMTNASSAAAELPTLLLLFAAGFFGFLATSVAAWVWFFVNFKQLRSWSGWRWDRPSSRVGLVDLIGCACCMIVAQFLIFGAIVIFLPKAPNARADVSVIAGQASLSPDATAPPPETVSPDETAPPGETLSVDETAASDVTAEETEPANGASLPKWIAPVLTLSYLIGGILTIMLVWIRTGATPRQLGIIGTEGIRDLRVGLIAFVLVTPAILFFSSLIGRMTEVEYDHPVIDAMKEYPWTFPLLFLGAVVCAPLWEEFVFRGLLIRWLDSVRQSRGSLRAILLGGEAPGEPLQLEPADPSSSAGYPPWWPAIASGAIFGLAHFPYGISWIPLIPFGIILGRLFQLRQSILPCVVLHACFNCLSMLGMAAQIFSK